MRLPHMKRPCSDCPFRTTAPRGWLGEARMREILDADSFACHKTLGSKAVRMQCAGHMLMNGERNAFVRTAKMLSLPLELSGDEIVFGNHADSIDHHRN